MKMFITVTILLISLCPTCPTFGQNPDPAAARAFRERYGAKPDGTIDPSDIPIFRMVAGQPYNTQKSVLWKHLNARIIFVRTNLIFLAELQGKTRTVSSGGVGAYSPGGSYHYFAESGKAYYLRNYPAERQPTDGKQIAFRAMQVGTTNINGNTLELWDYGTLYVPPTTTAPPITAKQ